MLNYALCKVEKKCVMIVMISFLCYKKCYIIKIFTAMCQWICECFCICVQYELMHYTWICTTPLYL